MVAGKVKRQWGRWRVAEEKLHEYLDSDEIYESKMVSPAKAEAKMGKKKFSNGRSL